MVPIVGVLTTDFHRCVREYLLRNEHWVLVNYFGSVRQGTKFGTWV